MTFADVVYALWALAVAAGGALWVAAVKGWRVGGSFVGRPSILLRSLFAGRTWLRVLVVLCWVWVGVHLFAR